MAIRDGFPFVRRARFWFAMSAAIAACAIAAVAQQRPPVVAAQQSPTFKVAVDYIEVDAVVTDDRGEFVDGLTANDFVVYEDGQVRPITVFSAVDLPIDGSEATRTSSTPAVSPDIATNAPFEGRLFVMILDDEGTDFRRTRRARRAAKEFLDCCVAPGDLAAVVGTGGRSSGWQPLTANGQLLVSAIEQFTGGKTGSAVLAAQADSILNQTEPAGPPVTVNRDANDYERYVNARNMLQTVEGMADLLAGIRGRRKALVLFSEGVNYDMYGSAKYAPEVRAAFREAIAAATRADVVIYGLDPRGLDSYADAFKAESAGMYGSMVAEFQMSQRNLQVLSDETGGFATINANNFGPAFKRILQENSRYYVLGYAPAGGGRDGKSHTIEVKVSRPGLHVRARKGYTAPKGAPKRSKADERAKTSAALTDAMASPLPVSGLPMRVWAAPFRHKGSKASVSLTLEVDASMFRFEQQDDLHTDGLEIAFLAANQNGKFVDDSHDMIALTLGRNYEDVRKNGVRLGHRFDAPPGRYRILVGARETNAGLVGTVPVDVEVPDFSDDSLGMSGLAITSIASSAMPTTRADEAFKGMLPTPPTALRTFPSGDTLSVFADVYDSTRTSHDLTVETSVSGENGTVVLQSAVERSSQDLQNGRYRHMAQVALGTLGPGQYVLRVTARSSVDGAAQVERTAAFRIRDR